jgi:hypothetical protein
MLENDRFLEKISYLIFLIFIFFSQVSAAETTISKILNYNASLINSSALFIQNDGTEIQEGEIYFGSNRIKINYKYPNDLTLVLSERKGVYINHDLKESQFFNTKKSYIKIFLNFLKVISLLKNQKLKKILLKLMTALF